MHDNTIDVYLARLRRKLRALPDAPGDQHRARRRLSPAMRPRRLSLRTPAHRSAVARRPRSRSAILVAAFNLVLDARLRTDADNVLRERATTVLRGLGTVDGRLSVPRRPTRARSTRRRGSSPANARSSSPPASIRATSAQARIARASRAPASATVDATDTRLLRRARYVRRHGGWARSSSARRSRRTRARASSALLGSVHPRRADARGDRGALALADQPRPAPRRADDRAGGRLGRARPLAALLRAASPTTS